MCEFERADVAIGCRGISVGTLVNWLSVRSDVAVGGTAARSGVALGWVEARSGVALGWTGVCSGITCAAGEGSTALATGAVGTGVIADVGINVPTALSPTRDLSKLPLQPTSAVRTNRIGMKFDYDPLSAGDE